MAFLSGGQKEEKERDIWFVSEIILLVKTAVGNGKRVNANLMYTI